MTVLILSLTSCETTKTEYVYIYPNMPDLEEPVFPLDPDKNITFEVYSDGYVIIRFLDTSDYAIMPISFLEELTAYNTDVRRYCNDYKDIKEIYSTERKE